MPPKYSAFTLHDTEIQTDSNQMGTESNGNLWW